MKKLILSVILAACCSYGYSQNFVTAYFPGYQLSGFHADDIRYNNSQRGDMSGKINHTIWKFDGIANHLIVGMDVTSVAHYLVRKKGASYYCAGFDIRLGYAANIGDNAKLGAGIDVGMRGFRYNGDTSLIDSYSYFVMGGTMQGVFKIGDPIYIMPKLSIDPVFSDQTDKVVDGLATKFEVSCGFNFGGALGISITPGFERLMFNYEDSSSGEETISKSYIKTRFLQFGLSFMVD